MTYVDPNARTIGRQDVLRTEVPTVHVQAAGL